MRIYDPSRRQESEPLAEPVITPELIRDVIHIGTVIMCAEAEFDAAKAKLDTANQRRDDLWQEQAHAIDLLASGSISDLSPEIQSAARAIQPLGS